MSDPRVEGRRAEAIVRTQHHDAVCGDDTADKRYQNGLTNRQKTKFICEVLRHPEAAFDLDLPFPVEDWIASDDNSLVVAGLYLSDLRKQFYGRLIDGKVNPETDLWQAMAEAEFWQHSFNVMVTRRLHACLIVDGRTLH